MKHKEMLRLFDELGEVFDAQFGKQYSPITRMMVVLHLIEHGIKNGKKAKRGRR